MNPLGFKYSGFTKSKVTLSDPQAQSIKRREAYKLCWFCNKRFRGNLKYEVKVLEGGTVYAHKQCIEDAK